MIDSPKRALLRSIPFVLGMRTMRLGGLGLCLVGLLCSGLACTGPSPVPIDRWGSVPADTIFSPNIEEKGYFGSTILGMGDLNGDGTSDWVVGAYNESVDGQLRAGRVYFFDGASRSRIQTLTSPNIQEEGEFGAPLVKMGDLTGDGISELAVGAGSETVQGSPKTGRVYLFSGADGSLLQTFTPPTVETVTYFGDALARVEDTNGDDTPDLVVGAHYAEVNGTRWAGRAYLLSGADGTVLHQFESPNLQASGFFGRDVAGIGDVNGDGAGDLLVGAGPETVQDMDSAGRAYLFSGADGALLDTLTSPDVQASGFFGNRVSALSDISGDGVPDFLVVASGESPQGDFGNGQVYLYSGADRSVLDTLASPTPQGGGSFGAAPTDVGDVDQDGTPDVFLGAPEDTLQNTPEAGRAYFFSGSDRRVLRAFTSPRPVPEGYFGGSAATVGDLDGDGSPDLLIGASNEAASGYPDAGRLYLYLTSVNPSARQ